MMRQETLLDGFGLLQTNVAEGTSYEQYTLAVLFLLGIGLAKDERQAAAWLHKAADKGLDLAQYDLAWLYSTWRGSTEG